MAAAQPAAPPPVSSLFLPTGRGLDWSFAGYKGKCLAGAFHPCMLSKIAEGCRLHALQAQALQRVAWRPCAAALAPAPCCRRPVITCRWRRSAARAHPDARVQCPCTVWCCRRRGERRHGSAAGATWRAPCTRLCLRPLRFSLEQSHPAPGPHAPPLPVCRCRVQDAVEAANSSPGVVFLPAGTYLITAPLVITGSNVTLRGEGVSARFGAISAAGVGPAHWLLYDFVSVPGTSAAVPGSRLLAQPGCHGAVGRRGHSSTPSCAVPSTQPTSLAPASGQ